MRIACPACDAAYEVPDHLIGPGRQLRCARCGHEWLVQPPGAQGAAEEAARATPPAPPVAKPAPRDPTPPHPALRRTPEVIEPPLPQFGDTVPRRRGLELWLAWIASILVLVLLAAALLMFRDDIVAAWPPAARLYSVLGLDTGR